MKCKDCKYYAEDKDFKGGVYDGICRRFPGGEIIKENDWCGEFKKLN